MATEKTPAWELLAEEAEQRRRDVPADQVAIAVEVLEEDAHEHCGTEGQPCVGDTRSRHESLAREILASLDLPTREAKVRADERRKIAEEIRDALYDLEGGTQRSVRAADEKLNALVEELERGDHSG